MSANSVRFRMSPTNSNRRQSSAPSDSTRRAKELEQLRQLRRQADAGRATTRRPAARPATRQSRAGALQARRRRIRLGVGLTAAIVVVVAAVSLNPGHSDIYPAPTRADLVGLSLGARIVAVANSQVGYRTQPLHSYCNKFSAFWDSGSTNCPHGELSEEWCADFAAWAWQKAGVSFTYGYNSDEINAGAASFYEWAAAAGTWHPAGSGYKPRPGDVAVYGLTLYPEPSAAHVAIVVSAPPGQRGPDVINGDGDRTGFSVVETGTDQLKADTPHDNNSSLAGYANPT